MSFDLKIQNGDLVLRSDGKLDVVFNEEKLGQEILKAIFTPTGSHKLHKWYGSPLQDRTVGKVADPEVTNSIIANAIIYALKNLQMLQDMQEQDGMFLTPREQIRSIQDVQVFLDDVDPRKLNVIVSVLTRASEIIDEAFVINI